MQISKKLTLAVIATASMFLAGCGPSGHYEKKKKTRIIKEVSLVSNAKDDTSPESKKIAISLKPIFGKNKDMFPQLTGTTPWAYSYRYCYNTYSFLYKRTVTECENRTKSGKIANMPLLQFPVFEVKVTNNTNHVLKFNSAVMAMEDGSGNLYDILDKKSAKHYVKKVVSTAIEGYGSGYDKARIKSNIDYSDVLSNQSTLTLIDNNFKVLPGRTRTGFISFNIGKHTTSSQRAFLMSQEKLNVQLFEIPIDVNKAGVTIETSSFSFNYDVVIKEVEQDYYVNVWVEDKKKK